MVINVGNGIEELSSDYSLSSLCTLCAIANIKSKNPLLIKQIVHHFHEKFLRKIGTTRKLRHIMRKKRLENSILTGYTEGQQKREIQVTY